MNTIPRSPGWWVYGAIGLGLSVAVLAYVVAMAIRGPVARPAPWGPGSLVVVATGCTVDRVALACDRWADAGWPRCAAHAAAPAPYVLVEVGPVPEGVEAITRVHSDGRRIVTVHPDACDPTSPTLEHELGHAVHGLLDDGQTGSVMCGHEAAPVWAGEDDGPGVTCAVGWAFPAPVEQ